MYLKNISRNYALGFSLVWGLSQTWSVFLPKIILKYQVLYIVRKVLISVIINRKHNLKTLNHVKVTAV